MGQRYDPDIHHRRSIRLQGYDYAQARAYFVTICTQGRTCLFGEVVNGNMQGNDAGQVVQHVWMGLPARFCNVRLDVFVVMPNHVYGIVMVVRQYQSGDDKHRPYETDPHCRGEHKVRPGPITNHPNGTLPKTLGRIMQAFKSTTIHAYVQGVTTLGWTPFNGKLWQRNYYDHVIHNDADLIAFVNTSPPIHCAGMENNCIPTIRRNGETQRANLVFAPTYQIHRRASAVLLHPSATRGRGVGGEGHLPRYRSHVLLGTLAHAAADREVRRLRVMYDDRGGTLLGHNLE
jgi:REP element-mobilizing transposase RayT